jgi:hypothetical protein
MRALAPSTRMRLFCWMALCRKAGPSTMYGRRRSASFYAKLEFSFTRSVGHSHRDTYPHVCSFDSPNTSESQPPYHTQTSHTS